MNRFPLARVQRVFTFVFLLQLVVVVAFSATTTGAKKRRKRAPARAPIHRVVAQQPRKPVLAVSRSVTAPGPIIAGGPWTEPTYADSTNGDNVDGEDLAVRRIAV